MYNKKGSQRLPFFIAPSRLSLRAMVEMLHQYGLWGLFVAGFLAGTVIPFNSESVLSVLILSGLDITQCFVVVTVANMLGGMTTFYLGYLGNMEWIEKYGKVKQEKMESILPRLNRYGPMMATLSFVPLLGNIIILGLGFFRISPVMTTIFMFVGKLARYLLVILLMEMVE